MRSAISSQIVHFSEQRRDFESPSGRLPCAGAARRGAAAVIVLSLLPVRRLPGP
jgi:hypothetical protein